MTAAVLAFPQTKKALRLRNTGLDAAGFLSLLVMERDGEKVPENVARFDEPEGATIPARSPELLLLLLLWGELTTKKQDRILRQLRLLAYAKTPDPMAVQMHNLLTGKR